MIQVDLSASELPIEPGGTAQLTATITNRQSEDDHVFIEVEGIDIEWYALPVPAVTIPAGQSQSIRIPFKLPRSSSSLAGSYPFVIRVKGMESGEVGVQQASLEVKPFSALQVELAPKRASAGVFRRAAPFALSVANLGNQEETLDLYASDPEDGCAYDFETDRVTLSPGHSRTLSLFVEPVNKPVFGMTRLFAFSVTARSVRDSYISASAQGQLERRPLLTPAMAVVLALLALVPAGWALLRPRPVVVRQFTATPAEIKQGETITLAWEAENMQTGLIQPDNIKLTEDVGSLKQKPQRTTTYTLIARGGGKELTRMVKVVVLPAPPPKKPSIDAFTASRTKVHQGDSVTLAWDIKNATQLLLNPVGKDADPRLFKNLVVTPDSSTTYVLVAKGPGGVVEKSVKVEVVPPHIPTAVVNFFRAKPSTITAGDSAKLSWSVSDATNVEIDYGVGTSKPLKSSFEVRPLETTTYTLRATDDRGNVVTAQTTVTVKPRPAEPEPTPQPQEPPSTP